ncbi:small ubiquitin-related modifier 2-like [Phyllostomus hastatus]|uniref:small ubiquitin-related modifier 2-like n=1 Tax=Phyllostomus hastatus TaxID=9423 RepID=UPI001E681D58|nr:small ubiquitin-related modifier 2-like [Phyllostomus hastatus]
MVMSKVQIWYLFCEGAPEETPLITVAIEKPKEGVKIGDRDHTNLKVAGQDGSVVQFKIKRHTLLSKLMKAYLNDRLKMEDEDTIDVFQQQTGDAY